MTGIYMRVLWEGHPQNLEIDTLTNAELVTFFGDLDLIRVRCWAIALAAWIRDHVEPAPPTPGSPS